MLHHKILMVHGKVSQGQKSWRQDSRTRSERCLFKALWTKARKLGLDITGHHRKVGSTTVGTRLSRKGLELTLLLKQK